jgi:surface antigen
MTVGIAAALTVPLLAAPASADASCAGRKLGGTVIGGVGGALIGNALGRGTGAVIGGVGGAVVGHELAADGCRHSRSAYRRATYDPPRPLSVQTVYYDQYGSVVPIAPAGYPAPAQAVYDSPACRTETRSYYDSRGASVPTEVRVCPR